MADTLAVQMRLRSSQIKIEKDEVTSEPIPDRPFYKADFKITFAEGLKIAKELFDKLEGLQISCPDAKHGELLSRALMAKGFSRERCF